MFDVNKIREDFPILKRKVHGHNLVYFDSGATSQKPEAVIEAINKYYRETNANI
ncbi:MAG: Cysteine desulfurase, partial [Candidatus Collierbacteria bacterium GW2011_GWE2_42_48]